MIYHLTNMFMLAIVIIAGALLLWMRSSVRESIRQGLSFGNVSNADCSVPLYMLVCILHGVGTLFVAMFHLDSRDLMSFEDMLEYHLNSIIIYWYVVLCFLLFSGIKMVLDKLK